MKSKRLIVILCALAFLTVLIVINSTIFTLQSVSINWLTTTIQLDSVNEYELTSDVTRGGSIFLVNKNKITAKLEKNNYYLRVVSIETVFPNKLIIHSAERESLYAVGMPKMEGSDYRYAIVDEYGKVLDITSSAIFAQNQNDGTKPIRVIFNNIPIKDDDFVLGEIVRVEYIEKLLSMLGVTLREATYTPKTSKGVFNTITIGPNGENSVVTMLTRNGMSIVIKDAEEDTTNKFLHGLAAYNKLHQGGVSSGTIYVQHSQIDGEISVAYEKAG